MKILLKLFASFTLFLLLPACAWSDGASDGTNDPNSVIPTESNTTLTDANIANYEDRAIAVEEGLELADLQFIARDEGHDTVIEGAVFCTETLPTAGIATYKGLVTVRSSGNDYIAGNFSLRANFETKKVDANASGFAIFEELKIYGNSFIPKGRIENGDFSGTLNWSGEITDRRDRRFETTLNGTLTRESDEANFTIENEFGGDFYDLQDDIAVRGQGTGTARISSTAVKFPTTASIFGIEE